MPEGGHIYADVSKAQLKREIASLLHDLYNIYLLIQNFKSQENQEQQIRRLGAAKVQIQKEVVEKEIALELKNTQSRRGRQ